MIFFDTQDGTVQLFSFIRVTDCAPCKHLIKIWKLDTEPYQNISFIVLLHSYLVTLSTLSSAVRITQSWIFVMHLERNSICFIWHEMFGMSPAFCWFSACKHKPTRTGTSSLENRRVGGKFSDLFLCKLRVLMLAPVDTTQFFRFVTK